MSYTIIGRGLQGWHASGEGTSISGYDTTPEPPARYVEEAVEGCWVYDAHASDAAAFKRFIVFGPMDDPSLAPGETDPLDEDSRERAEALCGPGGLTGGYDTLVKMESRQALCGRPYEYGSLDRVSTDIWIDMLIRHVRGVRVGRIHGGKVFWGGHLGLDERGVS